MTHTSFSTAFVIAASLAMIAAPAAAQGHARRTTPQGTAPRASAPRQAVPRVGPPPRVVRPTYRPYISPYRPYIYSRYPSFYYGYPYGYFGYSYISPYYGYPGYYANPGYYGGYYREAWGGVRIHAADRDAEVWADGYYAGIVDDFDGVLQELRLSPGPHHIEIRTPNAPPTAFDVNVVPGQTVTYRAAQPH